MGHMDGLHGNQPFGKIRRKQKEEILYIYLHEEIINGRKELNLKERKLVHGESIVNFFTRPQ